MDINTLFHPAHPVKYARITMLQNDGVSYATVATFDKHTKVIDLIRRMSSTLAVKQNVTISPECLSLAYRFTNDFGNVVVESMPSDMVVVDVPFVLHSLHHAHPITFYALPKESDDSPPKTQARSTPSPPHNDAPRAVDRARNGPDTGDLQRPIVGGYNDNSSGNIAMAQERETSAGVHQINWNASGGDEEQLHVTSVSPPRGGELGSARNSAGNTVVVSPASSNGDDRVFPHEARWGPSSNTNSPGRVVSPNSPGYGIDTTSVLLAETVHHQKQQIDKLEEALLFTEGAVQKLQIDLDTVKLHQQNDSDNKNSSGKGLAQYSVGRPRHLQGSASKRWDPLSSPAREGTRRSVVREAQDFFFVTPNSSPTGTRPRTAGKNTVMATHEKRVAASWLHKEDFIRDAENSPLRHDGVEAASTVSKQSYLARNQHQQPPLPPPLPPLASNVSRLLFIEDEEEEQERDERLRRLREDQFAFGADGALHSSSQQITNKATDASQQDDGLFVSHPLVDPNVFSAHTMW